MAPAVEAVKKEGGSFQKVPALNERILSSMSRRSVAAHPWHDLEIGILLVLSTHQFFYYFPSETYVS